MQPFEFDSAEPGNSQSNAAAAFLTNRRVFLTRSRSTLGLLALSSLLNREGFSADIQKRSHPALPSLPHFAPKAKRVIYLFQSGGPSHLDLLDYKPKLKELQGTELPESIRQGQRLTGMTSGQKSFPVVASKFQFAQHGKSGAWLTELWPHTAKVVDDLCIINSLHGSNAAHGGALLKIHTGSVGTHVRTTVR